MSSKTVTQQIQGDLLRDGKAVYQGVRLSLVVKEIFVDEKATPVNRVIAEMNLSPMSGKVIDDGKYTLRYTFDGWTKEDSVRVRGGHLLAA
jgi:hypothetical protein